MLSRAWLYFPRITGAPLLSERKGHQRISVVRTVPQVRKRTTNCEEFQSVHKERHGVASDTQQTCSQPHPTLPADPTKPVVLILGSLGSGMESLIAADGIAEEKSGRKERYGDGQNPACAQTTRGMRTSLFACHVIFFVTIRSCIYR